MRCFYRVSAAVIYSMVLTVIPARAADFEKYFPKETDVVISLNVRQVLDSPLVKKHALELIKTSLAGNKEAQQALTALGLDPLTDFGRVSVGLSIEDVSHPKAIILIEGKFDPRKMQDAMEMLSKKDSKQFTTEKVNGKSAYKIATPEMPAPLFAAQVDPSLIVLATSKDYVAIAFEAAQGTHRPEIKKALSDLIGKSDGKSSLTIAALMKGKLDTIPFPDDIKKVIDQIQTLSADLKVGNDVNLVLSLDTEDAEAAKQLQMVIAGGLDLAKIQAKVASSQQPELQSLVEFVSSMKALQKEKSVVITGNLTGETIDKLIEKKRK